MTLQLQDTLGRYVYLGFSLVENADHTLELYHKGKKIATYWQNKATKETVQEGCQNYLENTGKYRKLV